MSSLLPETQKDGQSVPSSPLRKVVAAYLNQSTPRHRVRTVLGRALSDSLSFTACQIGLRTNQRNLCRRRTCRSSGSARICVVGPVPQHLASALRAVTHVHGVLIKAPAFHCILKDDHKLATTASPVSPLANSYVERHWRCDDNLCDIEKVNEWPECQSHA